MTDDSFQKRIEISVTIYIIYILYNSKSKSIEKSKLSSVICHLYGDQIYARNEKLKKEVRRGSYIPLYLCIFVLKMNRGDFISAVRQ